MANEDEKTEPTLVERWLADQQEWQRTALSYLDSMARNEDFLVHLGNAMRGSLLAGKPYPTQEAAQAKADEAATDDRIDEILFALHKIQGELADLRMTVEELRDNASRTAAATAAPTAASGQKPSKKKGSKDKNAGKNRAGKKSKRDAAAAKAAGKSRADAEPSQAAPKRRSPQESLPQAGGLLGQEAAANKGPD